MLSAIRRTLKKTPLAEQRLSDKQIQREIDLPRQDHIRNLLEESLGSDKVTELDIPALYKSVYIPALHEYAVDAAKTDLSFSIGWNGSMFTATHKFA